MSQGAPDGGKIVVTSPFEEPPQWGFMPFRIEIENPSKRAVDWSVGFSGSGNYNGLGTHNEVALRAAPGQLTRQEVMVPAGCIRGDGQSGMYYGNFYLQVHATPVGWGNFSNNGSGSGDDRGVVNLRGPGVAAARSDLKGCGFDHRMAPTDWRAYAGYPALYLTDKEWNELEPGARTAIRQWIRFGGFFGLVRTNSDARPLADLGLPVSDPGMTNGRSSLGWVSEVSATKPAAGGKFTSDRLQANMAWRACSGATMQEWRKAAVVGRTGMGRNLFREDSSVIGGGLMVLVLVVFAIVVGPVNVFVLAPARRRHRLFFTTPIISLGAGLLLIAAVLLGDGGGGKGARFVWIENRPGDENMNYVVQHQHSHCGAVFTTGFDIKEDAFVVPMALDNQQFGGNYSMELTPGQVSGSGQWFASRTSQDFFLSSARPSRGRIEKTGGDDAPRLTSTFEFPLDKVFWLAPDGQTWWQAGPLSQGTATTLARCQESDVQAALGEATATAPAEYNTGLANLRKRPGFFVALADKIPAIETHGGIRWQTHGFVTGPVVTP